MLRDEASALIETALSLAGTVVSDIALAVGQTLSGIDLSGVEAAAAAPGSTVLGTAAYGQAMGELGTAQAGITTGLVNAGGSLAGASAILGITTDPLVDEI